MQINRYFKTPIKLKRLLSTENDMNLPEFSDEEIIMARADGQAGLRFGGHDIISSTDYVYLVGDEITVGSLLNDMPVKNVEPIYEFNGKIHHYEVIAGPAR